MTETREPPKPRTALRARYRSSCALDLAGQTGECIEYLENPGILVAEFSDSFLMARERDERETAFSISELPIPRSRRADDAVRRLVAAPCLALEGDVSYGFRYVARDIVPLWKTSGPGVPAESADPALVGIDYVALSEEDVPAPILGVVAPPGSLAPYLLLLRALCCLSEVSTETQLERINRFLFKDAVSLPAPFDIHLLMVRGQTPCVAPPLAQLTRDLADVFSARLREEWELPDLLRNIFCLEMPAPGREFGGRFKPLWRV